MREVSDFITKENTFNQWSLYSRNSLKDLISVPCRQSLVWSVIRRVLILDSHLPPLTMIKEKWAISELNSENFPRSTLSDTVQPCIDSSVDEILCGCIYYFCLTWVTHYHKMNNCEHLTFLIWLDGGEDNEHHDIIPILCSFHSLHFSPTEEPTHHSLETIHMWHGFTLCIWS